MEELKMDKRTMNIEKRIYMLNKKIKEANRLRTIFSSTAAGTAFIACLLLLIYASIKDASVASSIIIFTLCFILFAGFIFSMVVVNQCEDKVDKWKTERHYLISRVESIRNEFNIANAFANCYWNALSDKESSNLEIDFNDIKMINNHEN